MRRVFLDTSYLQALADPGDDLHNRAQAVTASLDSFFALTSEMVLVELLNALSGERYLRQTAIQITHELRGNPNVEIVPQTSEQFEEARQSYQQRLDKGYSLTDCASMLIMREKGIQDVLTYDQHFKQEGFNALLRKDEYGVS
ncbi:MULTISPECIES: type II toxin-antitoxin system VapC family toxin [unclassified Coleofasciculus]|uniref:type II toxin-antitoxin system VapC family toxin n=1 Tax=unclassified Coleofasciculus TaxID=2692782 RepID=UPI001881E205|nr:MULTISPECIES: PIN domain-containing protein [unclassified Coleofasciculus]MBE9126579.1 type II toxin-antitoxin system VapC family toxin [Coleofasciculus sp. LEGE 07081]MBE9149940.1 type II toxin-antitoxin system VapC family toxin [Coleofasciculus sp. LEGE 07092]